MIQKKLFHEIRKTVKKIPRGKVTTYGAIAEFVGTRDARLVGYALWGNQDKKIPCHRVVKKQGFLAEKYSLEGWQGQKSRLLKDGVIFVGEKQVDLKKHFWQPR